MTWARSGGWRGSTRPRRRLGWAPAAASAAVAALLLDTYTGAAVAFSTRKLRTAYSGPCLRVRRSSDDVEQDIGFTSGGVLDAAALLAFCGAADGHLLTWYDQSGNANHATNAFGWPKIVVAGALQTANSKASPRFTAASQQHLVLGTRLAAGTQSVFAVVEHDGTDAYRVPWSGGNTDGVFLGIFSSGQLEVVGINGSFTGATASVAVHTTAVVAASGANKVSLDGGTPTTSTQTLGGTNGFNTIGRQNGGNPFNGAIGEVIVYLSDKSTDRASIEANQKAHWGTP